MSLLYTANQNIFGVLTRISVINPANGSNVSTLPSDVSASNTIAISALAVSPVDGKLWGVGYGSPTALWSIDTSTGVGYTIGTLSAVILNLAFRDNILYGLDTAGNYGTINLSTGVWTALGAISGLPSGLIYSMAADVIGRIWIGACDETIPQTILYRLTDATNPSSGLLFQTSVSLFVKQMSFNAVNVLYGVIGAGSFDNLYLLPQSPTAPAPTLLGPMNGSTSDSYNALAFAPPACIDHETEIEMADGTMKHIEDIRGGDHLRLADGQSGEVLTVVNCVLQEKEVDLQHLCVVFEPGSLAPGIPSRRFAVDPGHPIALPADFATRDHQAFKMARTWATHLSDPTQVHLTTWAQANSFLLQTRVSRRFDIILAHGQSAYLANGVAALSRASLELPGYDHKGGFF